MRAAAVATLLMLAAGTAHAQPADPIGDALARAEAATAPVNVDEVGRTPDGPPTARDLAYESRIRAAAASAQGFQGPLDGSWTLAGEGGDLYAFTLVDRNGAVEGAWRDLARPGALQGSGFIDAVERTGAAMTLRFAGVTVALTAGADGRWTGALEQGAQRRTVTLRRSP